MYTQSHVLGFNKKLFLKEHQTSKSLHSHRDSSEFPFSFELRTLSFSPHLLSHDSC